MNYKKVEQKSEQRKEFFTIGDFLFMVIAVLFMAWLFVPMWDSSSKMIASKESFCKSIGGSYHDSGKVDTCIQRFPGKIVLTSFDYTTIDGNTYFTNLGSKELIDSGDFK